ncbi:ABC transporter permease DevC [Candidatus Entotheonella palauensis]|uniref:ABC3 transporter permease C-terminal domain-containing protein n=1 Tax=Candidatus Entotheonella gemina TaxID=1429439 RepID=W4M8P3_9BACT|nr:ABC transporter permease DevC [Candidatus Entotheonella palauensis]ETX06002.1 MAG: hypothetical protein ETSY2_19710 [Candidatus Entotheonella gemina]
MGDFTKFRSAHVPLARQMLWHDRWRLLRSIAGIAFAVFLIFAEIGFLNGLYDNQVELIRQLNADIIITHAAKRNLNQNRPFSRRRLYQAKVVPGVIAAYPLHVGFRRAGWKNPDTHHVRPLRILAIRPGDPVFTNPAITAYTEVLKAPGTVLMDTRSKAHFGRREAGVVTELEGMMVRVVGTFELGTDFVVSGNVLMSDQNLPRYLSLEPTARAELAKVELGVVHLAPHADTSEVAAALRRHLPQDVLVETKETYLNRERRYWRTRTPIGAIFGFGAAMGVVIGVIICYQILYTNVLDHLPQFATLKAIGYTNRFLIGIVLKQALMLSCFGFLSGLCTSLLFYRLVSNWSGLLMHLTPARAALVFSLTVGMCLLAGTLAIRRIMLTDPAEVF